MRRRIAFKRKLFIAFVFGVTSMLSFLIVKNMIVISAVNSAYSGFDAGNIISDGVMSDYGSMNEAEIQAFMKSKNSCNDTNIAKASYYPNLTYHIENGHFVCLADEKFNGESAAHIIWQAAQDYKINPKVLIVLLEKEQGLITDTWPNSTLQYRSATGYGCPDTAACDSQYYGFKNQVRNAAELFRYILDNGSRYYPIGNNYVKYNPDGNCGGSNVSIKNRATSALYQYTPYQPNASVLNANPGTVVHCGAYGNSNFYYYYTRWFGDAHGKELTGVTMPSGVFQLRTISDTALSFESSSTGASAQIVRPDSSDTMQQFKATQNGKYYRLQNVGTGKYLGINNNKSDDGAKVELQDDNNSCGQKWLIRNNGDKYRLISACSSEASTKSLDVSGAATSTMGAKVHLWSDNSGNAQLWRFVNLSPSVISDGVYNIKSTGGKVLTPISEQHSPGVNVTIWENTTSSANRFNLVRTEEGSFRVIDAKSNLYLAVYSAWTSDGTNAILYSKDDNTCAQRWIVEKNGGDGYSFKNSCSGKSLDIEGGAVSKNDGKVQIWSNNTSDAQKWYLSQPNTVQPIANGVYVINSAKNDARRLDVVGSNKYSSGANVQIWERNGSDNQKYTFSYDASTGYYTIASSLGNNLYLDAAGASSTANIQLYTKNNTCAQQWILLPSGNQYYIISACTRTVIDIAGGNTNNGTNVGLWSNLGLSNQKWSIVNVNSISDIGTVPSGDYIILSKMNPNLALDISGASTKIGTNVGVWTVHKGKNQQFRLKYDSGNGLYTISNTQSNQNLDITGAMASNGTNLQIWSANSECAQKWQITKTDGDNYRISSACNLGYSLDISGAENRAGANVLLWSNHGGSNQQWKFAKV